MTATANHFPTALQEESPGLEWDEIPLGASATRNAQPIWRRTFPGGVEWRIRPEPLNLRGLGYELVHIVIGATIGVPVSAYLWGHDPSQAALVLLVFLLGFAGLTIVYRIAKMVNWPWRPMASIQVSGGKMQIEAPTAPRKRRRLDADINTLTGIRVGPERRFDLRTGNDFAFGWRGVDLMIERRDSATFELHRLHAATAEAIAREISEATGLPILRGKE